ncbi:uncharacterized protein LOC119185078 isoform X4 [Rhipicephalus microplus]|uniref:uncharacterized protein LOC119185078 isoform X4 n=1 Tax=Rhipicephalus microplus TaxID=6941 RepID=UPI003F6AF04E
MFVIPPLLKWTKTYAMNPAQKELMRTCPYDSQHKVKASRYLIHLMKCRKTHSKEDFSRCPFTAEHVVPADKLMDHIYCCPLNFTAQNFAPKTA